MRTRITYIYEKIEVKKEETEMKEKKEGRKGV